MKFVMLTYIHVDRVAEWDAMSDEERAAIVNDHLDWFRRHGDRISGGSELAHPPNASELTATSGGLSVVDGPFAETKEVLGGFVVFEADSLEAAKAIAAEWPNLERAGNRVVVAATAPPRNVA